MIARRKSGRRLRRVMGLGLSIALGAGSATADPPDDAAGRDRRMGAELETQASAARATRTTNAVIGVVAGLVLMPTGILLETRTDIIGVGMTIAGATQLALVPLWLVPSGIERVEARHRALRGSGASDDLLLDVTEEDWRGTAESTHSVQLAVGWTLLGLGTASASTALALLLANPGNSRPQYSAGAILSGAGVPLLANGLRLLLQPSAEETSWRLHQGPPPAGMSTKGTTVSASPVRGGVLLQATASF